MSAKLEAVKTDSNKSASANKTSGKTSKKRGVTRDSIIDAGLKLFADKGFDGTSVKDLEAEVGLKPGSGSFYRHFKSKEDLMEEVIHREVERVREYRVLQDQLAEELSGGEPLANLEQEMRLGLVGLNQIEQLITLLGREYGNFPTLMQQLRELLVDESLEFRAEDLANGIAAGHLRDVDPKALSAILLSSIVGYHLASKFFGTTPGNIDEELFVSTLVKLIGRE